MSNLKRLILIVLLMFFSSGNFVADAATINAQSCSLADVTTAYNAAAAGDTVSIPAGECTWDGALKITKAITLQGAGGTLTKIIRGGSYTSEFLILTPLSDLAIRVTGIYFYNAANTNPPAIRTSIAINGSTKGIYALTKIRIDNNTFHKGRKAINILGWTHGVIDHNAFINCSNAINFIGSNAYSWGQPIVAGRQCYVHRG